MIHLSRLVLHPRGREVRRDLADCQDLHRTIMAAFPQSTEIGDGSRQRFGVLFRLEPSPRGGGPPTVLVQSEVAPDWSRLPPGYLLEPGDGRPNPACRLVDDHYRAIRTGATLRFRLRANPTKKIDTKSGPDGARRNGRRVRLGGEADRLDWLERKGNLGGFGILSVQERPDIVDARDSAPDRIQGNRRGPDADGEIANRKLTFDGVVFDGNLVVTDAERFYESLRQGIGPAKAYGFGLLSIGPARE